MQSKNLFSFFVGIALVGTLASCGSEECATCEVYYTMYKTDEPKNVLKRDTVKNAEYCGKELNALNISLTQNTYEEINGVVRLVQAKFKCDPEVIPLYKD
ncbi:MAG: hypothetical protein N4A45_04050 [Flavobacteriales bacterium]|jgi:hypothetical protein|nr:hypothetical protein [Flavobacteriales bacterium]